MAIRLIRATNSEAVTVYDDAVVFHSAKGHDYTGDKRGGVFEKVYFAFNYIVDNVNKKFIIKSGMGMLYGRQFELAENETAEFSVADQLNRYLVYYLEIKNELISGVETTSINIKSQWSSISYPSIGNTDLIVNRYGTATMELYRIRVNAIGAISEVIDRRYIYRSGYAEKARMMDEEGVINSRKVGNLIYSDKDVVKNTDHAYYADRAKAIGLTGTAANRNLIDDNLYMKNRDGYLLVGKEITIKTPGGVWSAGTYEVGISAPSGNIIGCLIYGNETLKTSGLHSTIPGSSPLMTLEVNVAPGKKVTITMTTTKVTMVVTGMTLSGPLYMAVLMMGTRS